MMTREARGDVGCCGPVLATLTPYSFFLRHRADPCLRAADSGEKGSLLETGGFRPRPHPQPRRASIAKSPEEA